MAEDESLKVKLLRIQAKIHKSNRKECLSELFQWLVERRFRERWPETEEECVRILSEEISQQVYDIALSKSWIWEEQVKSFVVLMEYIHGPGVREINERNRREAYRLPTVEEVRNAWWADLILEWQARFLESKATLARDTVAVTSAPCVNDRMIRKEGDYWTLVFAQKTIRLRDSKGILYLSYLLGSPGQEFPAPQLLATAEGHQSTPARTSAGEVLDQQAMSQYRARANEIKTEIEQARENNDQGRVERLRIELESLVDEISAAEGLRGRSRTVGDTNERARKAVWQAITRAVEQIRRSHLALAQHLDQHLSLGTFLSYAAGQDPWIR